MASRGCHPHREPDDPLLGQRGVEDSVVPVLLVQTDRAPEDSAEPHVLAEDIRSAVSQAFYRGFELNAVSKALFTAWQMFIFFSFVGFFRAISFVFTCSAKSIFSGAGPDATPRHS